jgi:HEPN domain-containing protein
MNNEEKNYLLQWIGKAEEDLLVVQQLMLSEIPIKGAIAYHCQQAAEKFLKAFMLYHKLEIPKTHNIEFLLEKCLKIDERFSFVDPGNLTDYGVEVRYPGDFLEPSLKELETMISVVKDIRELALGKLKL